ncbi:hypothetical protein [Actinomadura luteofluorescens]|uniref:hypothetical protein n=1 Tax=Actinomadura luteofluorescens TaxID=46163 RepID=UPI002164872D|nr:hypothetical protein [Actinomadura glauciflava]
MTIAKIPIITESTAGQWCGPGRAEVGGPSAEAVTVGIGFRPVRGVVAAHSTGGAGPGLAGSRRHGPQAVAGHLTASLAAAGVPEAAIAEIAAVVMPLADDIVSGRSTRKAVGAD